MWSITVFKANWVMVTLSTDSIYDQMSLTNFSIAYCSYSEIKLSDWFKSWLTLYTIRDRNCIGTQCYNWFIVPDLVWALTNICDAHKANFLNMSARLPSWPVWPDWAIYWTLGNFLKPSATINLPKSFTSLGNFYKDVKSYHFSSKTF